MVRDDFIVVVFTAACGQHPKIKKTILATDSTGAKLAEMRYRAASRRDAPWGEPRFSSGAALPKYTYTGQRIRHLAGQPGAQVAAGAPEIGQVVRRRGNHGQARNALLQTAQVGAATLPGGIIVVDRHHRRVARQQRQIQQVEFRPGPAQGGRVAQVGRIFPGQHRVPRAFRQQQHRPDAGHLQPKKTGNPAARRGGLCAQFRQGGFEIHAFPGHVKGKDIAAAGLGRAGRVTLPLAALVENGEGAAAAVSGVTRQRAAAAQAAVERGPGFLGQGGQGDGLSDAFQVGHALSKKCAKSLRSLRSLTVFDTLPKNPRETVRLLIL